MNRHDPTGPAFPSQPVSALSEPNEACPGMSLRDYLAAKAMASLIASPDFLQIATEEQFAKQAYFFADAMLAARKGEAS